MARRLVFKESGLNSTANTPNGFRFVGYDGTVISEKWGATVSPIGSALYGYENFVEVDISSSEILNIKTSPVQILPTPPSGSYYDFKVFIEYTHGTSPYTLTQPINIIRSSGGNIGGSININGATTNLSSVGYPTSAVALDQGINISTSSLSDPTGGDGTIKVKLYYNTITFG